MDKTYAVYILANSRHGTLYTGVTSDILGRIHQHRAGTFKGFTSRYAVRRLVWIEWHTSIQAAIEREKRIKAWKREWKVNLIETTNHDWSDLAVGLGFAPLPTTIAHFRNAAEVDPSASTCHPGAGRDP